MSVIVRVGLPKSTGPVHEAPVSGVDCVMIPIADVMPESPVEDRQRAWKTAFKVGAAAARAAALASANPWQLGTVAGAAWYCGWCSVADHRDEKPAQQQGLFG